MSAKRRSSSRSPANRPPPPSRPRADVENLLLAHLPSPDYRRISSSLVTLPLTLKTVIYEPGAQIEYLYFPGGGFCSILTVLDDRSMVEVATVGREGMVGVSAILNAREPTPSLSMVQAATDTCYRMPIEAFRREFNRHGAFHTLMTRYAVAHMGFVMQSTACNAKHSVEKRLARWLLLAHDRVGVDEFPLTQEFLAMMLGASRPTVTVAAGALQKAGLIAYRRGILRIANRTKLEKASCECYRVTTRLLHGVTAEPSR